MPQIAIDVVLLPSIEMTEKVIEINQKLLKDNENRIIMDKEKCLAHVSLCMGCIEDDKLQEIIKILEKIASRFQNFHLRATELKTTDRNFSEFIIKKQDDLQILHEMIMQQLWPYLSYNPDNSMLYNPLEIEAPTLDWIKGYAKNYNEPALFRPHLTIGFGKAEGIDTPIDFIAPRIALCQLGNLCTCRSIIADFDLK